MSTSSNPIESSGVRPASCRPTRVFKGHKHVTCVAYFPDGRRIASASGDKTVVIWNVESGRQDGQPLQHDSSVSWMAISPDGRRIASGIEKKVVIWDALTREVVHEFNEGGVWMLAYSSDGRWIATAPIASEREIRLWDADTGRPRREPLKCDGNAFCVAFSPDGTQIAAGCDDGSFELFDIATGEAVVGPIKGHTRNVMSVVYSRDGCLLVTGSDDKSIRVWDAKTGVQVGRPMLGHKAAINSISITPDGRRIASGDNGTVRVWDLETRLQVGDSFHTDGFVYSVAFCPDGRYIIGSGNHDAVSLWDTESFAIRGSSSPPTASNPAPPREQRQAHAKPHDGTSSIGSSLLDLPAVVQQQSATRCPQERKPSIDDDWDTESIRPRLRPTEPQQDPPLEQEISTVQPTVSGRKWSRDIRERWRHIRHRKSRVLPDSPPHLPLVPLHEHANAPASPEVSVGRTASHSRTQPSTNQDEANVALGKLDERLYAAPPRDRNERRRWRARERRRAARNASPDSEPEDNDAESYYEDTGCLDAVCFGEYFRRRRHLQRR
ncbi:WD40 repeat-like protein [Leucogyrophana mollusca]|uniref:WD40 repeat-like protein n=1 Tax=Leucogyrophana mollusca TaxID=85980 RepID=A0ACB8BKD3_9AGAM|nr:WD40 repeat-like protein [Leucogyrophana mollusca]